MRAAEKSKLTPDEFLAAERRSEVKHEYLNGEVFAMPGGTRRHSLIAVNLASALNSGLASKPCQVFNSDMRLKIEATGLSTYPDVQVACSELRFDDDKEDTLLNPVLIAEVLSDSTAAWDRGEKFWHYRHLASLKEYVLVSQHAWLVEHFTRQPNGAWLMQTHEGAEGILTLTSVDCAVPLAEIYAKASVTPNANHVRPQPADLP